MKKQVMALIATSLFVTSANAGNCGDGSACGASSILMMVSSWGVSAVLFGPFITTSNALQNDMIAVQADAAVALETGVASPELLSVIERIRAEIPQFATASDRTVVAEMLSSVKIQ